MNKNKKKPRTYLGLFIVLWGGQFMVGPLEAMSITTVYPALLFIPINSSWLLMPLFFLYVQRTSIFANNKTGYWLLIPGIISFLLQLFCFLLPVSKKIQLKDSNVIPAFWFASIIYALIVSAYIIYYISLHKKEITNQYSSTDHKKLNWACYFVIFLSIPILILIKRNFIEDSVNMELFFSCYTVLLMYWLSIQGLRQTQIMTLMPVENPVNSTKLFSRPKNKLSKNDVDQGLKDIVNELNTYLKSSQLYLNKDLTISEIAEYLKIHPKRISTAINNVTNQNFNSYINKFRIEKALELMNGVHLRNYSIEGIGEEVGFNSKSAFYSSFKKNTGTTPSNYMGKPTGKG
ncbi:AraC-like DNA-binding protein [Saonia flava]|uniref:AraC-like DNA-binding protein n=1 Tax=Saonia flava TaxID=523696 RepID=A0A846QR48_9FLAO|nr:helix-turn-helix transcriptional regulator [Saonia flava]NJB70621.1 AraC-like DNA-binding protein [Saonia flava]